MDDLESEGLAIRASSSPGALQRVLPLDDFPADVRSGAMKAMPSYLAFYCLENSARQLVSERLQETQGTDWWTKCISAPIQKKVEDRKKKEGSNRWHIERGAADINYTDFGDLRTIIVNNWPAFEDLFPDQNWISSRLNEFEASRNIIAHSNLLDDREIARMRLYLGDWTKQVG